MRTYKAGEEAILTQERRYGLFPSYGSPQKSLICTCPVGTRVKFLKSMQTTNEHAVYDAEILPDSTIIPQAVGMLIRLTGEDFWDGGFRPTPNINTLGNFPKKDKEV